MKNWEQLMKERALWSSLMRTKQANPIQKHVVDCEYSVLIVSHNGKSSSERHDFVKHYTVLYHGRRKNFFQGGNRGEISFYPLETKRTTFFALI